MFWFVCRRIALFPTILHGEKGFLLVCGESRRFLLDFNKSNVSARLLLSYAVFSIVFLRATIFSVL